MEQNNMAGDILGTRPSCKSESKKTQERNKTRNQKSSLALVLPDCFLHNLIDLSSFCFQATAPRLYCQIVFFCVLVLLDVSRFLVF